MLSYEVQGLTPLESLRAGRGILAPRLMMMMMMMMMMMHVLALVLLMTVALVIAGARSCGCHYRSLASHWAAGAQRSYPSLSLASWTRSMLRFHILLDVVVELVRVQPADDEMMIFPKPS